MTDQTTERQWWKKEGDHYHVTIQMHHNQPPMYGGGEMGHDDRFSLWFYPAWDSFMVAEALTAVGLKDEHGGPDEDAMMTAFHARTDKSSGHAPPREDDPAADVFWIMGSEVEMKRLANYWGGIAIADVDHVGGDDSYYDYYPDYLDGLWQLCRALDFPDPYMAAASHAWSTRYEGDPEADSLIPTYNR